MKAFLSLILTLFASFAVGQSTTASFDFEGQTRSYRLYVPASYQAGTPSALVFNLHGYTSNAQQQEFYSGMNAVADTAGFILVYPDGVNSSWNSGFGSSYSGGVNDVGFISALIDSLSAAYSIDSLRIYSCGMSNGGFMSFRLACDLQHRIAAIASVTGTMSPMQLDSCKGLRAVPVLQIHGTNDPTVPYGGSGISASVDATLNYWRSINQCNATIVHDTFPDLVTTDLSTVSSQMQDCILNTEVVHFKIENGGHTWPGALAIPGLGVTNQDINGSNEIWKFFLRHRRPASVPAGQSPEIPSLIKTFPNPFSSSFTLAAGANEGHYLIFDGLGREILRGFVKSGREVQIYGETWSPGIYHLVFETKTERLQQRLIKQ